MEHRIITHRGTDVEMVRTSNLGVVCYMDGLIQSCEADEEIYHSHLVHPIMKSHPKRVLIMGGGEGATAREVLRDSEVESVDMIEWDIDVIYLFQNRYPQWAKGAWNDPRLRLITQDAFDVIQSDPKEPYDAIIVDLFDPEPDLFPQWATLLNRLSVWLSSKGSIVFYTGMMDSIHCATLQKMIREAFPAKQHQAYDCFIPSFLENASFLLIQNE